MISVRNLCLRYEGSDSDALHDVSIDVAEGSFTAIMGANGSGKSTLSRCLNGLLQPTSGEVVVDNLKTSDIVSLGAIRRNVGFVFQDPNVQMTSATVERELAFGLQNFGVTTSEIHRRVDEELQRLGLVGKRLAPPSSLSGGEKQRLALASVMMLEPTYLVLDEPTSFLSPFSRKRVLESVMHLRQTKKSTVILITQYFAEAMFADRLIVLHQSHIALDDIPSTVLRRSKELSSFGISLPATIRPQPFQQ